MNLLQRQGFFNSIILYAGTVLGFFNLFILFQRYLSAEEIGFFNLMVNGSVIYAQIASLGISGVILKYFPYYRTQDKNHKGFVSFVLVLALTGFIIFTILYLIFKGPVIAHYKDSKGVSLLIDYYNYLIPISFLTLGFTVLESMARVVFKNILSAFLKEMLLRLSTTIAVILIAFLLIDFHDFLIIYLFANVIITVVLWYSIFKDFKFSKISGEIISDRKELLNYGFFAVLGGGSFTLMQSMAVFMLTAFTDSLSNVGIYGTFFGMAVVISLPARALGRTSYQIVAEAWVHNDLKKIDKIYYKTSVVQSLIGSLILIGLIINQRNLIYFLHKPAYAEHFDVFIVIGLAFLVDITGGLNGQIINLSKYYKFTTYLVAISVIICAFINFLLIPVFGILGAAIAYLITMLFLNIIYWSFIKIRFNIHPFGKAHLFIAGISLVCLALGLYLPLLENIYFDLIYRSAIVALLYSVLVYVFKVSEDINSIVDKKLMLS